MRNETKKIQDAIQKIMALGGPRVKFIILYGSVSTKKQTPRSDIDLAVYYDTDKNQRFKFRMNILGRISPEFDVTIFQDLPLYMRQDVVRGKVLYAADMTFLYDVDRRTYQDFEDFKHRFYDYIKGGVIT